MNRDFKGIWIPKEIWLNKDLTMQEKIFFVEINSLDNDKGCFASNGYFADFFGISKTRVSLVIKNLIKKKAITSTIIYKEGTKQILKRVLNICYIGYLTKVIEPIQQKLKDNNTVNNTTNNTIDIGIHPKRTIFKAPTLEESKAYFLEKASNENEAVKFWNYYESIGWKVGKNKMQKWRSSASGWIARNKDSEPTKPIFHRSDFRTGEADFK